MVFSGVVFNVYNRELAVSMVQGSVVPVRPGVVVILDCDSESVYCLPTLLSPFLFCLEIWDHSHIRTCNVNQLTGI